MHSQDQICRIYWKKTEYQSAKILRIFAEFPTLEIPDYIDGYPVTEIANYCFAPDNHLQDAYLITDINTKHNLLAEFCGNYPQTIILPNTLRKIGDYAFYNCRHLSELHLSGRLQSIGSDAFMNCHHLHQIFFHSDPDEATGLRQILAQISWEVEVSFGDKKHTKKADRKAVVFYPEFYETFDEIAPAHIFGSSIVGEGFRARQCFSEEMIDFTQYDQIFPKACIHESEQVLCHMAFCRIRYPYHLQSSAKQQYDNYIHKHIQQFCEQLIQQRQLDDLMFLYQEDFLTSQTIQYALSISVQAGWSEGSASMLRWQQSFLRTRQHKRYKFENF